MLPKGYRDCVNPLFTKQVYTISNGMSRFLLFFLFVAQCEKKLSQPFQDKKFPPMKSPQPKTASSAKKNAIGIFKAITNVSGCRLIFSKQTCCGMEKCPWIMAATKFGV